MRTSLSLAIAALLTVLFAAPAAAHLEHNPQASLATDVSCENGATFDELLLVGRAGHSPTGPAVGVATSVHILSGPGGDILATEFDLPGVGLDNITVWCEWFQASVGFWVGGDIVVRGNLR